MAEVKIRDFDSSAVTQEECQKASLILEHAHDSARSIYRAFGLVRGNRTGKKGSAGTSTDDEQDLLRAMLVMTGAGLDSMAKQLIHDALPSVAHYNEAANDQLESFVRSRLSNDFERLQEGRKARFVPSMLASVDLQQRLIDEYVAALTAGSLQSAEELRRIAAAFGLTQELVSIDFQGLQEIFGVRNKIIHELDINLMAPRRNRNTRKKDAMVRDANRVLDAGESLLLGVDKQVATCKGR